MKVRNVIAAAFIAGIALSSLPKAEAYYALPSPLDLCNWHQLSIKTCAELFPNQIDPASGLPWSVLRAAEIAAKRYAKCQRIDRARWYKRVQAGKAPRNAKQEHLLRWAAKNC